MPDDGDNVRPFRRNGGEGSRPHALPLTFFRDTEVTKHKRWLIKKVMAYGEISSWIGAPGAAKSALLTDVGVYVPSSPDWRGYRIPEPTGVVYFALERAPLVTRRLFAYRQRDLFESTTPIAVAGRIINLMSEQCLDVILETIDAAEQDFGRSVGLIVIDTYNKGIAAGGGDENKARDQNIVAANMRRILERRELHIATIGHTGKDPERGERGSNARLGDVDLEVVISGEATKTAVIDKANDQEQGQITSFAMESVEVGHDDDDEAVSTHIVTPYTGNGAEHIRPAKPRPGRRREGSDRDKLRRAIVDNLACLAADEGKQGVGFNGERIVKVRIERLRDQLVDRGILDMNGTQIDQLSRSQFRYAKLALHQDGRLMQDAGWIWLLPEKHVNV